MQLCGNYISLKFLKRLVDRPQGPLGINHEHWHALTVKHYCKFSYYCFTSSGILIHSHFMFIVVMESMLI